MMGDGLLKFKLGDGGWMGSAKSAFSGTRHGCGETRTPAAALSVCVTYLYQAAPGC